MRGQAKVQKGLLEEAQIDDEDGIGKRFRIVKEDKYVTELVSVSFRAKKEYLDLAREMKLDLGKIFNLALRLAVKK